MGRCWSSLVRTADVDGGELQRSVVVLIGFVVLIFRFMTAATGKTTKHDCWAADTVALADRIRRPNVTGMSLVFVVDMLDLDRFPFVNRFVEERCLYYCSSLPSLQEFKSTITTSSTTNTRNVLIKHAEKMIY